MIKYTEKYRMSISIFMSMVKSFHSDIMILNVLNFNENFGKRTDHIIETDK